MRIGIDARWIFPETSGITTYTRELIRELARLDTENEYVLFFNDPGMEEITRSYTGLSSHPNFRTHRVPCGVFSPFGQARLPVLLRRLGVEVFHSPNYMIPFLAFPRGRPGTVRCVVTIHDLIPLLFPEFTPKARKTKCLPLFRRIMMESAARADVILTVSEWSRRDVLRELRVSEDRSENVVAVPNGVAAEYVPAPRASAGPKTLLYVGRFDPYKNIGGLLDIFARVRAISKKDVRLRIVGSPDPRYPEPLQKAREKGLEPHIEWAGYCGGADLVRAYQQADVFVLPSRYEGFGLTVIEAMACGTPVVCSNRSSLPEVAGDAARLFDPDDVEGFACAIVELLENERAAAACCEKGLQQARKFTWARTAEMTLNAYKMAAEQ